MQSRQSVKAVRRTNAEGLINLKQVRRWFTQNDGNNGQTGAGASSAGTQNTEHMIPKARFDEINDRMIKAEADLAKIRQESETAEQARLVEQGKYQQLAEKATARVTELEPYKTRAEIAESSIIKASEALIASLPEDIRDAIVPKKLSPTDLYDWLVANVPLLLKRPAPNLDAGAGGGAGGTAQAQVTEADRAAADRASASGYPVKAEDVAKRRAQKTKTS